MDIYLQGLTIGLAYCAPIGLQNLFLINTALTQRRSRVYLTVLIIIFFDVTLGMACFFGIGAIMSASPILEMIILGIGSLIVIWIGQGLVRAHDTMDSNTKVDIPIAKVITTACVVTWWVPLKQRFLPEPIFSSQAALQVLLLFGSLPLQPSFHYSVPNSMTKHCVLSTLSAVSSSSSTVSNSCGASSK